ncbi:hypothetical protein Mapa_010999 [Marchantia paleacea]|nr:hypothetical protein Mapa_010999 [Marchantia paleacea]
MDKQTYRKEFLFAFPQISCDVRLVDADTNSDEKMTQRLQDTAMQMTMQRDYDN